jgi:hypothetical protein
MTLIGKVLVFTMVIISIAGLGMAAWLSADQRDWKGEHEALRKEIAAKLAAAERQRRILRALLVEITKGERLIPWEVEVQGGDPKRLAPPKMLPVMLARQEVEKLKSEIDGLTAKAAELQGQITNLQAGWNDAIAKTVSQLKEYQRLRQMILPDAGQEPGKKALRDLIAEQRADQKAAEGEQDKLRPNLLITQEQVQSLQRRLRQQQQRLMELEQVQVTARTGP